MAPVPLDATPWEDANPLAPARTCNDCYFRKNALCALDRTEPCPTFRGVRSGRMMQPQQATLVAQTDRGQLVALSTT